MSCVTRDTQSYTSIYIYPSIAQTWSAEWGATPRGSSILVNRERVGERGTAGGRGLGRPFDFERAYAHSNGVLYQVSPPVTLTHALPILYLPTMSHSNDVLYQGDCECGGARAGGGTRVATSWNARAHRRGYSTVLPRTVTENN